MKDILVFLSPAVCRDNLSRGGHYAIDLARTYGAHLSALIADIESDLGDLAPQPDIRQVGTTTASKSTLSSERVARTAELVQSAATDANIPCDILQSENQSISLRERIIHFTQMHDMLILDVRGSLDSPRKELVEAALFGGGRPIVFVPPNTALVANNRIVVAWDGTRSAVRAVHDALPLLVKSREVLVVSVIDDKLFSTPHSGHALCRYLTRWEVDAKFSAIRRETLNIGTTLLACARHAGADLIVMGAFAHGFERALMLGSATRDIFEARIEIPVLLSH
ncbi:universal stress protein [Bradyrhizobium cenepequi]|uniref:universal stress protein n=1 Tax=Bradyrhizobium cenepequi TaxID=2821403 RepID=UPI001CE2B487|nr:universal stress protein [Bradyrhizobium cenepequi]MCA6108471.1 universal stress protein [Bradyrhizobium cenepequi]